MFMIKMHDGEVVQIQGASVSYDGDILEVLDDDDSILGVFRGWKFAIIEEDEDEDDNVEVAELILPPTWSLDDDEAVRYGLRPVEEPTTEAPHDAPDTA
jgi:hypothetical protein